MNASKRLPFLALAALLAAHAVPAFGADALFNCQSGVPYVYPNGGADIPFNPDLGGLGPLTNAQGVLAVTQAFAAWANVSTATATFLNAGPMPFDVDITNYVPILNPVAPDGLSPIVFDENGAIFTALFGSGSGILGFASPDFGNTVTCELIEGSAFLNGPEFDDLTVAADIMVHEFGHYFNLGHVELNGQLVSFSEGGDTSGPSPDNTYGIPGFIGTEVIETMYPFYFSTTPSGGAGTRTPHADDIASISTLYPDPSFGATTGTISGTIYAPNGTTRLSGVNVIARNVNDPFVDSVSTFSGAFTDSTSQADPNVGTYTLSGLTPGAQYAVFVDEVTALAGRFSNPILATLPGPEEFWNGASESSDPTIDDPLDVVTITAVAGSPANGTDIIFNGAGPGQIVLGDDDFAEIFMPFAFELCGQSFNSVFVNSNGSLTFGAGDTDFSESVGEFLGEVPRIAGLWDDLNPSRGGVVSFSQTSNTFSVRFENVPEFLATGANTFEFILDRSSSHIDVVYGNVSATDGLAGVSCGSAITSGFETGTDLSAFAPSRINLHNQPAVYQLFPSGTNDLANSTVRYNGTTDYNDNWAEPNDSLASARNIAVPFSSADVNRYTEIEPAGGDVDFYEFSATAGDVLVAELVSGQIDSVMGLFDVATGTLLAFNDDISFPSNVLSRILYPISVSGDYAIAVSTFDDFDFDGDGSTDPILGQGRYVLEISTAAQLDITLGDDNFAEIPLGFTFPYQGSNYTSVFVNSNGNLTFGSGDTDFSESVGELLNDQPRIAALWDDLSPNNGGSVFATFASGSLTVTFDSVPEFVATGSNTFSVTMAADGTVTIDYGSVTALDGIVGLTPGGGVANPGETDFSAGGLFSASGTTYERFTGSSDPFDLDGATLVFDP